MLSPARDVEAAARRLAAAADRAAVLFDFDGTLAPIVDDPEAAAAPDQVLGGLAACARRFRRVGVVTGRRPQWVAARLGVLAVDVVGSHGMERARAGGPVEVHPLVAPYAEAMAAFAREAEAAAAREGAGVVVEPKAYTVSLHYRTAPDAEAARAFLGRWAEPAAAAAGLAARHGRLVLEVRPPVDVTKGTAVAGLVDDPAIGVALFAGDDTTDLDAFRALRLLARDGILEEVVLVAAASDEADRRVAAEADLVVDGPPGVARLVELLAQA
jgi:trehalose 6-phosphate phosphatase